MDFHNIYFSHSEILEWMENDQKKIFGMEEKTSYFLIQINGLSKYWKMEVNNLGLALS